MSASVGAYWPGITEEQRESQPGFYNDYHAWGAWMAERETSPEIVGAIKRLGCEAILSHTTEGMSDDDVKWVSPSQLRDAAKKLRNAVGAAKPEATLIVESYERNADGLEPVSQAFMRDLLDVEALASWAEKEGAKKMTLEVNW